MAKSIKEVKDENYHSITFSVSDNILLQSTLSTLEVFNKEIQRQSSDINSYRARLEAATEKRDEYKGLFDAAIVKRDEYKGQLDAAVEKRDEYKGLLDAAIVKRDEYKEQLDAAVEKRDEYKGLLDAAIVKRDEYKEQIDRANESLYNMIQNAVKHIIELLPQMDNDSMMKLYIEDIKKKGENTNNKGLAFFSQYSSIKEIAGTLNLDDSALSMIANLIWWSEQRETKEEIQNKINNIDMISFVFNARVLIPLELAGYKVNLPVFGLKKDVQSPCYVNIGEEDSYFKELFETKLDDYACCRIYRLSYNDSQGKLLEYYNS